MCNCLNTEFRRQKPVGNILNSFSEYERVCKSDPDVQSFDDSIREKTCNVFTVLQNETENTGSAVSIKTLKEASTNLLEIDHGVMEFILVHKDNVWKDPDLYELVKAFVSNSKATLKFCRVARNSIECAKRNQMYVQNICNQMSAGHTNLTKIEMEEMIKEMQNFQNAGNPFSDLMGRLVAVQKKHQRLLIDVEEKMGRLEKKLREVKTWRRVTSAIFVAAVASIVICAVVAAAIAAPPLIAGALAAASSFPLGSVGSWVEKLWRNYEKCIEEEREAVRKIQPNTFAAISELNTIQAQIGDLESKISSFIHIIKFADERRDLVSLQLAIERLSIESRDFIDNLEDLERHLIRVQKSIIKSNDEVLRNITTQWGARASFARASSVVKSHSARVLSFHSLSCSCMARS